MDPKVNSLNSQHPLVSIGVPVYNEESFLRETLESLLSQDYKNLEIVISDNASTDQTSAICQEMVSKDSRICYFRADTNRGAIENFNTAFQHSKGEYFMWAGAHDLWDSKFISQAIALLQSDPSVILAYSETMLIDADGRKVRKVPDEMDTRDMSSVSRYLKFISTVHWCNMIHGLIRRDAISNSSMLKSVWGPDLLFLAELSLQGEFAQIPEILFYRRENRPDDRNKNEDETTRRYVETLEGAGARRVEIDVRDRWSGLRAAILRTLKESDLAFPVKWYAYLKTLLCFRIRFGVSFPGDFFILNVMRITHVLKAN